MIEIEMMVRILQPRPEVDLKKSFPRKDKDSQFSFTSQYFVLTTSWLLGLVLSIVQLTLFYYS